MGQNKPEIKKWKTGSKAYQEQRGFHFKAYQEQGPVLLNLPGNRHFVVLQSVKYLMKKLSQPCRNAKCQKLAALRTELQ